MDTLGLVKTIHARSEGIIEGICNGPDRGSGADLVEALGETNRRELRSDVAVCDAKVQPTMRRENAPTMKHT